MCCKTHYMTKKIFSAYRHTWFLTLALTNVVQIHHYSSKAWNTDCETRKEIPILKNSN